MKYIRKLVCASLLAANLSASAQNYWTGQGTSLNWTDAGNWALGVPGPADTLYFEDLLYTTGYTNAAGLVNNVVDTSLTVGNLIFNAFAVTNSFAPFLPQHYYTTLIPSGSALTVGGGFGGPAVRVGWDIGGLWPAGTVYTTVTGPGSMAVTNTASTITVSEGANASGTHKATLDLSGLNIFTATVSNLWVGVSSTFDKASGAVLLARTNSITTPANPSAPGILLGRGMTNSGFGSLTLGTVNTINTDGLVVGGARASLGANLLSFPGVLPGAPSAATLTLRGSAGGASRTSVFSIGDSSATETNYLSIANNTGTGSSASAPSTADFTAGKVNILVTNLYVARSAADNPAAPSGTSAGTAFGSLVFNNGFIDALNAAVGYKQGTNRSIAVGALTVAGNAVLTVSNDLVLAFGTNGIAGVTGTLNVNDNATVNIGGNLTNRSATATVNLGGGTINMVNGSNVVISALQGFGSISNSANITVSNTLALGLATSATPIVLKPGTINLAGNLALQSGLATRFKLGSATTPGNGINDYLNIGGNLTLNANNLDLGLIGIPAVGSYEIIHYGGSKAGAFNFIFANTTRNLNFALDQATANSVRVLVGGGPPASLTWKGGSSGTWDLTNSISWNNNTEKFYTMDNVLFDDTGSQPIISIPSGVTVSPGTITFNNNSKAYTLYFPGKISGYASVTKNGTGTVIWDPASSANDFTGPININQGVLQTQTTSGSAAFGATNKLITIAAGATLDAYGNTIGSSGGSGWPITFSGSGVGGIGAIAHTKPSSGPTLYTPRATLAGDATIGVTTAGLNLFVSGPSVAFSGVLDLAGNTLTAGGAGNVGLVNLIVTNTGNIQVNSANLTLRDIVLDGSGNVTVGNKNLVFGNLSSTAWTTGYVAKAISIGPGLMLAPANSTLAIPVRSPISLSGTLTVSNAQPIRLSGTISGSYGLSKLGVSSLVLAGTNTYSGTTLISGGTLALDGTGSVANSPLIRVDAAGVLDVTARAASYTLPVGQTLQVDGSASGNLTVPTGATLAGSGFALGTVTVNGGTVTPGQIDLPRTLRLGNLSLNNASLTFELDAATTQGRSVNDLVATAQLALSGTNTIRIVPIGSLNNSGGQYTLFTYTSDPLPSSVTNNIVLVSDTRYSFSLVDPATTPGSIQMVVTGGRDNLVWQGGAAGARTAWDIKVTTNWSDGISPSTFYNGDTATFDDTAVTNRADLIGTLRPASINMANNSLAYTFGGTGSFRTGALTNGGSAGLTFANLGNNALSASGLYLNAGYVTFNQPTNATFTGLINGTGPAPINKVGTNRLTLVGDNGYLLSSPVNINAGTLQAGWTNALGSGTVTVASGATLDLNGQQLDLPSVAVSGAGVGGLGAIVNTAGQQLNAFTKVTLNGDTTLNSSNRWDVAPGTLSSFQGQNNKLTKVGPGDIWIGTISDTGLGAVDIQQGRLVFAWAGTDLGDPSKTITVRSNASLAFANDIAAGPKPAFVQAGGDIEANYLSGISPGIGANNSYAGNVTFASTGLVRVANLAGLTLSGTVQGPAGIVNADRGSLTLAGSNAYTGDLTVNLGQVYIASSNALPPNTTATLNCIGIPSSDGVWLGLRGDVVTPTNVPLNMTSYRTPSGTLTPTLTGQGNWQGAINMISIQTDPSQNPTFNFEGGTNLIISGPVIQSGSPYLAMNINGFPGTVRFAGPLQFNGTMRMGSQGLGIDPILTQWFTTMELDSSNNAFTNMLFWRGKIIIGADNAIPTNCPITTSAIRTDNDARGIIDLHGHVQTFANFPGLALTFGSAAMPIWFGNDSTDSDAKIVFSSSITNNWLCWIVDGLNTNGVSARKTGLSVTSGYLRLAPWGWSPNAWFHPSAIIAPTNNAYTGPTLVSGGVLQMDTMITNTPVTVSGSGTLAGSGPIYGPITVASGGTLSPGGTSTYASAVGILTNLNALTLQAGSKCYLEVNLTLKTNDLITGLSNVVYGGTLVITNVGAQAFTNGTVLKFFNAASYTAGSVQIQPAAPAAGLAWDVSRLAVDGTVRVLPAPGVFGITRLGNGNVGFNITGAVGQAYSVRASTNVALPRASWSVLQSGTLPSTNYFFQDLTATNYQGRYYLISTP